MQKIRDEEINAPAELPRPKYRINQSLTLVDLSMAFVVQSIGLLLGFLAFLGEYSRNNKKGKLATYGNLSKLTESSTKTERNQRKPDIRLDQLPPKVVFLARSR